MDILKATAADLGRAIAAGKVDPVTLADAYLAAIAAHPDGAAIYARAMPARARAEAEAARARAQAGLRRGPLDGVPLSWKDLFDTAGTVTEAGTRLMQDRVPARDADVLARATQGGTIALGKTHMSEIAFSGLGYNPITATPPNVNNPAWLPGGSSSGAAASVAFGLAPLAIGSDTGGSIRLPAAWNNLVGFKPAHGALPLTGVVPLCPSFDTVGPLARTVEDASLAFAALGGPAVDLAGASLQGADLVVLDSVVGDGVDAAPADALEAALSRLSAAGAKVRHARFDALTQAYDLALPIYGADAYAHWRDLAEARPEVMYPMILERLRGGAGVSAADYIAGWDRLRHLRAAYAAQFAGADAVICASAAILPPETARVAADADYYRAVNLRTLRNTRMGNLMGLAAISLPTGHPACGVMLHALPGAEGKLLRLAAAAEAVLSVQ